MAVRIPASASAPRRATPRTTLTRTEMVAVDARMRRLALPEDYARAKVVREYIDASRTDNHIALALARPCADLAKTLGVSIREENCFAAVGEAEDDRDYHERLTDRRTCVGRSLEILNRVEGGLAAFKLDRGVELYHEAGDLEDAIERVLRAAWSPQAFFRALHVKGPAIERGLVEAGDPDATEDEDSIAPEGNDAAEGPRRGHCLRQLRDALCATLETMFLTETSLDRLDYD